LLKARVRLRKERSGEVRILVSSTEIGQGAATVLRKIVARTLRIPLEQVTYVWPDTDLCPDSGPTVASRTTMVVGRLLEACACELRARMEEPEVDMIREYADLVPPRSGQEACRGPGLRIGERLPPLEWDNAAFRGHAYPEYAWGANAVDVTVDPATGEIGIESVKGVFDVGTPIDERLLRGQIEGGMVQGLGYGGLEVLTAREGRLQQVGFTNYILPTTMDVPPVESRLVDNPNAHGPYGARGAGELTLVGAATALALAVSDAIGKPVDRLPVTPEAILSML
jgi:CO/xanthine dehydrogenase Mo-binding subunit